MVQRWLSKILKREYWGLVFALFTIFVYLYQLNQCEIDNKRELERQKEERDRATFWTPPTDQELKEIELGYNGPGQKK